MTGNLQADGVQSRQTLFVRYCLKDGIPRLCGEKFHNFIFHKLFIGSPPPMRGKVLGHSEYNNAQQDHPRLCGEKPPSVVVLSGVKRITPAYAGKRRRVRGQCRRQQDHPRLCGEKYREALSSNDDAGSPPPMRGKVPQFYFSQIVYRITPAYAGKRRRVRGQCRRQQDHPRLCGEKLSLARISLARQGSPPPMRGKVHTLPHSRSVCRDHPRLCGEKSV